MKKVIYMFSVFGLCLGLAACGKGQIETATLESSEKQTELGESADAEQKIRICLIGSREPDDVEWNAFCAGARDAAETSETVGLEVELEFFTGVNENDWKANVKTACESGYDVVIGANAEIADYIVEYGSEYPDVQFVVMDAEVELEQAASIYIDKTDAYFLAGAAASLATSEANTAGINEEPVLGWIGGMNLPVVKEYFEAFMAGAKYINSEVLVLEEYIGSWEDPDQGKMIALDQMEDGADVILCISGDSDFGIAELVKEKGCYLIGTDTVNQEVMSDIALASISVDMETVGYLAVKGILEEEFAQKTVQEFTMRDGCVVLDVSLMESVCSDAVLNRYEVLKKQVLENLIDIELWINSDSNARNREE